jgi:hypothetical protein
MAVSRSTFENGTGSVASRLSGVNTSRIGTMGMLVRDRQLQPHDAQMPLYVPTFEVYCRVCCSIVQFHEVLIERKLWIMLLGDVIRAICYGFVTGAAWHNMNIQFAGSIARMMCRRL